MQSSNRPALNKHERPARQPYLASGRRGGRTATNSRFGGLEPGTAASAEHRSTHTTRPVETTQASTISTSRSTMKLAFSMSSRSDFDRAASAINQDSACAQNLRCPIRRTERPLSWPRTGGSRFQRLLARWAGLQPRTEGSRQAPRTGTTPAPNPAADIIPGGPCGHPTQSRRHTSHVSPTDYPPDSVPGARLQRIHCGAGPAPVP